MMTRPRFRLRVAGLAMVLAAAACARSVTLSKDDSGTVLAR